MARCIAAVAAALTFCLVSAASAEVQAVVDLKRLCMDTQGDPVAAFAAADAAGWGPARPEDATNLAGLSGSPDGRMIQPLSPDYRVLTASIAPTGLATQRKCVIISKASFEDVTAAIKTLLSTAAEKKEDKMWTWSMMEVNGVTRAARSFSPDAFIKARHRRLFQVYVMRLDGGSIIQFNELK